MRSGRGTILTEAGNLLAQRGREIVRSAGRAVKEIREVGERTQGSVAIGFPPSLGLLLSVPLAETIQGEYPDVRLRISEGLSGDIVEWIENDRIDLGCVYELCDNRDLVCEPLMLEKMFFVTAPDNMPDCVDQTLADAPTIQAAAIRQFPLALPAASHGARKIVQRFAAGAGFRLNVAVEIDSLPQIITMVTRASAYTILPHAAVVNEVATGTLRLIEIIEPTMTRTAYLLRKRSRPITRASRIVQDTVTLIVQEMIERFQLDAAVIDGNARNFGPTASA
nr:LysR substrate-binding domain-containing protein [Sphingobium sp.]